MRAIDEVAVIAGMVVAERYRLDRKLGEGGMGAVWAATHIVTRKHVAIKVLRPELATSASLVERFLREARAACAVQHPNVVQIHDVLQMAEGAPVMVMDLLEGQSLAQRLAEERRLPVPEVARIVLKVLPAIAAAHAAHVVHRDLKPDNLFLCRTEDGSVDPRVLDFGIAKVSSTDAESGVLTKTGSMLGTPFYMAPEQLFGERDVDYRADIWSLGIIVYECLAGHRPTEADNLGQIIKLVTSTGIAPLESVAPHVPPEFCAVVHRMLTSDRRARLDDLGDAHRVFARYAGAGVSIPSISLPKAAAPLPTAAARPLPIPVATEAPPALTGLLQGLEARGRTEAGGRARSERPLPAEPPRTGPTHWVATRDDPGAKRSRPWLPVVVVAVAAVAGIASLGVAVKRLRSGHLAAAPSALLPSPPETTDAPLPSASVSVSVSAPTPAATADLDAGASAATPAHRPGEPRPAGRNPHPAPSASPAPASAASTPGHGVLVDKPPF